MVSIRQEKKSYKKTLADVNREGFIYTAELFVLKIPGIMKFVIIGDEYRIYII